MKGATHRPRRRAGTEARSTEGGHPPVADRVDVVPVVGFADSDMALAIIDALAVHLAHRTLEACRDDVDGPDPPRGGGHGS